MGWKKILVLIGAVVFLGAPSYAELVLDSKVKPEQVIKILDQKFETVVRPYSKQHAADFGGGYGKHTSYPNYDGSNFAWVFDGVTYYSNITAFVPEIAPLDECKPNVDTALPNIHCDSRRNRFMVCHLFMFNGTSLVLENVTRLNILRDKMQLVGLPMCLGPQAMAAAKVVPNAILVTLGYDDSAAPASKFDDAAKFSSTLLLRLISDNGKLKIEQDDSCLGNPNKYKTISAARAALGECIKAQ